jgi:hypothetical protein
MKQFYSPLLSQRSGKTLLLSMFLLAASYASQAQVYTARLSGPAEAVPNNSPGVGTAIVTVTGTMMRVQVTFSGLLGNTTASHIHALTPTPLTGAAGVATTTPTFAGFPLGVTSGTYDNTLDMTQTSSYNAPFVAGNGGTTAGAFAALLMGLNQSRTYLNVHSTVFPGGEIRGFLVRCPIITVSIPDAFALSMGVLPNTVYPAYAPASSLSLTTNVSGGTGPYTYNWSNGATASGITVSPTVNTVYTVAVKDFNNCPGTASKTVYVMDISSGKKGDKITVCHKDKNSLSIATPAVDDHLNHGDMLGSCSDQNSSITKNSPVEIMEKGEELSLKALPNPSMKSFDIQLNGKAGTIVQLKVYDMLGRVVDARTALQAGQTLKIGSTYKPGIYIVEVMQGGEKQTIKLVKSN